MKIVFWIEKNWGGSLNDFSTKDFSGTLGEMMEKEQHASAFWMGCCTAEYVLKIEKNLNMVFIYGTSQDQQTSIRLACSEDIHSLGVLFLKGHFRLIADLIKISSSLQGAASGACLLDNLN